MIVPPVGEARMPGRKVLMVWKWESRLVRIVLAHETERQLWHQGG